MVDSHEITQLLLAWGDGDRESFDLLIPIVERELRRMAARLMRREGNTHTLETDALVNEAYLRLIDQRQINWQGRAHFFALAATIMRRVLIDHAKRTRRQKRGGGDTPVDLAEVAVGVPPINDDLIALDQVLTRLAQVDPIKSRIVELRHFGGLSIEEVAMVLGISTATVMRHWTFAKAWLKRELRGDSFNR